MLREIRDQIKVGAQPIAWSNDDFRHLGKDTSLDQCLAEMRMAGYAGTEMGHKFPRNIDELEGVLRKHDLELVSAWHSMHILDNVDNHTLHNAVREDLDAYFSHFGFLYHMGCSTVIVAECSRGIFSDPTKPLVRNYGENLHEQSMQHIADRLNDRGAMASRAGMKLVYHPHIGSVIQNESEVERLMERTNPNYVHLLADTGHIALAGGDVTKFFEKYRHRIAHVHLKNVRQNVVDRVWDEGMSFEQAVVEGVFTVPGDDEGCIDYVPLFQILRDVHYEGWLVVEAEQDPEKANPFDYFTLARKYIRENAGV